MDCVPTVNSQPSTANRPFMQTYSAADIERILRLPRSTLRGLIKSGFVKPERGPRRELRFSSGRESRLGKRRSAG